MNRLPKTSDEMKAVGERLQEWRKSKKMTQRDLEAKIMVSCAVITRFEDGTATGVTFMRVLYAVAAVYGIKTMAEIIGIEYSERERIIIALREMGNDWGDKYRFRECRALHKAADVLQAPLYRAHRRKEMMAA